MKSILEKLNPKAQFKKYFLKRLPQLKEELSLMLDDLFLQQAARIEGNPFELSLVLLKKKNQVLGMFFNKDKKNVGQFDAGALIQSLFQQQLANSPEFIQAHVLEEFGTSDSMPMLLKSLAARRLLIYYGEHDAFSIIEVTKKGQKTIDLDTFFTTLEF